MSRKPRKTVAGAKGAPALVVLGLVLVVAAIGSIWWANRKHPAQTGAPIAAAQRSSAVPGINEFVGSEACARCHADEYAAWRGSTHGRAGGSPNDVTLIAQFDSQPLRFKDAVVTPTRKPDGSPVFVVEDPSGDRFEVAVDAVVGGGHMIGGGTQSFFARFPDGTMRFLPFDYIRKENQWFVQLRHKLTWVPVTPDISLYADLANWPPSRVLGTSIGKSNCQNCHGSQIAVVYDQQQRRYETHYQTLAINCESCHGPGKRHIEMVNRPAFEQSADIGMTALNTLSKEQSLQVCFQCHATKTFLREEPYLPGARVEDYFSVLLPLFTEDPFTVDGRVNGFGYQSNHMFSDCYLNGSMTCVDCHDPHSQSYRDVFGRRLVGRFDNRQCTSCHASKASGTEHSHHKGDSPGNQCTSCHMPFLQHQGTGQHFVFARSDHSIPIPRPAFDQHLGIVNACQKCHADKDLGWQEAKVQELYGSTKPHSPVIAGLFRSRDNPDPGLTQDQLLAPEAAHPMAQMRGLATFVRRFVRPGKSISSPEIITKLQAFARHENLDLKALGLMALHIGYGDGAEIRSFIEKQRSQLGTNAGAVEARWAIAADAFGTALAQNNDLASALVCFQRSLEIQPRNVATISHLALGQFRSGEATGAIETLRKAIAISPATANLYFQLAQIHAQQNEFAQAIETIEKGLQYAPHDEAAKFLLEKLRSL